MASFSEEIEKKVIKLVTKIQLSGAAKCHIIFLLGNWEFFRKMAVELLNFHSHGHTA